MNRKTSPSTRNDSESDGNPDMTDDDDEELMRQLEEDKRRSERLRMKLDSAGPGPSSTSSRRVRPETSVFGVEMVRNTKQRDREMQTILRERNERKKIEQENRQLRVALKEAAASRHKSVMTQEEKIFADMATVEIRNEEERQRRYEKYNCAIALFLRPPDWPSPSSSKWKPRISQDVHPIQEMLQLAHREGGNLHQRFPALVKTVCEKNRVLPQHVARMLFYRVVYDPLDVYLSEGREFEVQGLLEFIPYACNSSSGKLLPSMIEVLQNYGAVLSVKATSPNATINAPEQSLDKRVMNSGSELNDEMLKCVRNLSRAFKIWTALAENGANYLGILGEPRSSKTECCLSICKLCVQVLLSPFGSRLEMVIELFLTALLTSINRSEWVNFRQQYASFIAQYTTRLGLQVDLIEYLLPSSSERSQTLRLDVAFITLNRWCKSSEVPTGIPGWPLSNGAISFRLSHVMSCMSAIPELTTETDAVWLLLLARLIRILLLDFRVLATQKGQFAKIQAWEKKMRKTCHRTLPHCVEKHLFLYSLNTCITALNAFVGNNTKLDR